MGKKFRHFRRVVLSVLLVASLLCQSATAFASSTDYEGQPNEIESTESEFIESDSVVDDSIEGASIEGESTDGESTESESTEGESTEGESTESESTEGESTEGESTESKTTEGESTEGESTENKTTESESTEGESTEIEALGTSSFSTNSFSKKPSQTWLNHVDVYVNGLITIHSQINNVTQSDETVNVTLSNLTVIVNGSTYKSDSTRVQSGTSEYEYTFSIPYFSSKDLSITISGTISSTDKRIDKEFTKTLSEAEIMKAIDECPGNSGCDVRISAEEISNIITHSVIFKTEPGGTIDGGTSTISYTNMLDGSAFPSVPETEAYDDYSFKGWYNSADDTLVSSFPTVVTADLTYVAKWTLKTANYKVEHYKENTNGSYDLVRDDTETLSGKIKNPVSATPNNYANYTYNPNISTASGTVTSDGKLVLKLYYDINEATYSVEHYLEQQDGTFVLSTDATEIHSAKIGSLVVGTEKSFTHYTFNKEMSNDTISGTVLADNSLILKLYYDIDEATYSVEHYLEQEDGTFVLSTDATEIYSANIGSLVVGIEKSFTHYAFNQEMSRDTISGTVLADNSLVLKLYYDLTEVKPKPVISVSAAYFVEHYQEQLDGTYALVTADTETLFSEIGKTVTGVEKTYENYTFNSTKSAESISGVVFAPSLVNGSLNILTLKLYYDINEATYNVEHYLQQNDGSYKIQVSDTKTLSAKIGTEVAGVPNEYDGYTYSAAISSETAKGIVLANGTLTLKLYYTSVPTTELPTPVKQVGYTVQHFLEQKDGSWKLALEQYFYDTEIGKVVTAKSVKFNGYSYSLEKSYSTSYGVVTEDGKLVLKLYYVLKNTPKKPTPSKPVQPTTPTTPTASGNVSTYTPPKTGDSRMNIYFIVMLISGFGLAVDFGISSRRKHKKVS